MKKKTIDKLVIERIILLVPLLLYGIYKNGFLLYKSGIINMVNVFKPLYLTILGVIIKVIVDLIFDKVNKEKFKIKIDENLLYVILVSLIMPYNINYLIYILSLIIILPVLKYLNKYVKFNKVCFIYLIIILINGLINNFSFLNTLELTKNYEYTLIDYLFGRNIGGISSTSIILSLISYILLSYNFYYKKEIPFYINISYIICAFIYFLIFKDSDFLINSELIFGSIFISSLNEFSPVEEKYQRIYAISIGVFSFLLSIILSSIVSIYIITFLVSCLFYIDFNKLKNNKKANKDN